MSGCMDSDLLEIGGDKGVRHLLAQPLPLPELDHPTQPSSRREPSLRFQRVDVGRNQATRSVSRDARASPPLISGTMTSSNALTFDSSTE